LKILFQQLIKQKQLFDKKVYLKIAFLNENLIFIATDFDDHTALARILEEYDSDNKQIRGGCYYYIDETHLFRVKHVLSYFEANRQVFQFY